jgi:hypothetical protein
MKRRTFIECAGGLLMLPMLDVHRRAQAATSRLPAKRFVAFGVFDGVIPSLWFPAAGSPETDFTLPSMLEPMSRHRANMIITKGVDNRTAIEAAQHNGHIEGMLTMLTGWMGSEIAPKTNNWAAYPQATSLDQRIARELDQRGVVTRYQSIIQGGSGGYGGISYADGRAVSGSGSATKVFASLFGDPQQSADAIARARALRKSVLDGAIGDYQRLATRVSGEDRTRVTAHLDALRDVEKRILGASATACDRNALTAPVIGTTRDVNWRASMDLAVAALTCDATRVAVMTFDHAGGGGPPLPWIGVNTDMHELSHQVVGAKPDSASVAAFTSVVRWFNGELAYFVDRLKATKLPDGNTLLDETVVFQGSEISYNHACPDMPYLLVAGDKTPLRTGRFVQVGPKVPHNNLLVTLLHAFGIDATSFGNPAYSTGNLDAQLLKA